MSIIPITKEEYIGQMKMYFPHLKRWRKELVISGDTPENPAIARPSDSDVAVDLGRRKNCE